MYSVNTLVAVATASTGGGGDNGKAQNPFSKSVFEFNVVYNRFCLKRLQLKLKKLRIAIFGQFWLKLAVFSMIHFKKFFRESLH